MNQRSKSGAGQLLGQGFPNECRQAGRDHCLVGWQASQVCVHIFGIKPQYLDRRERRGMKFRIMKLSAKMTNKLRKFLRWTNGLSVIIKNVNTFERLLRTKLAYPFEEIE